MYGLKQAPHVWYKTLVKFLKKLRFIRLELDHEIFVSADKQLLIAVYVNKLLFFVLDTARLEGVQQKLENRLKMTDLGDVSHYLEMQVDHIVSEKITLCQNIYLKKVLNCFKITKYKSTSVR